MFSAYAAADNEHHKKRSHNIEMARHHFHLAAQTAMPNTQTHYDAVTGFHAAATTPHHDSLAPRTVNSITKKAKEKVEGVHKALENKFPLSGNEKDDNLASMAVARNHVRRGEEHARAARIGD